MQNEDFNKTIRNIFARYTSGEKVQEAVYKVWINKPTTQSQNEMLGELMYDAERGQASCPDRYLLGTPQ